jgi:tRNA (mo5U34)-methyltransferase
VATRDLKAIQAEIDAIQWYHEFDFGDGLRATTNTHVESHRMIWKFIESNLATVDFRGKSVLDIGSWDGYWSFHAETRGAKSVLATDDVSQNWAAGTGIHLAKELLKSRVEINQQMSVYNLSTLGRKFDVILYLGVYYHLHDPFNAFAQIRHCCHENTVVLIDGPVGTGMVRGGAVLDFFNHTAEFLPSTDGLQQLTDAAYFRNVEASLLFGGPVRPTDLSDTSAPLPAEVPTGGRLGWRWRLNTAWQALRGRREKLKPLVEKVFPPTFQPAMCSDRIFVKCKPFAGKNEIHVYPPPFGLRQYDDRFRVAATKAA